MRDKMRIKYANKNMNKTNKKQGPWSKFGVWQLRQIDKKSYRF